MIPSSVFESIASSDEFTIDARSVLVAPARSVMSRAIDETPSTLPSLSRMGDTVREMEIRRPSFRTRTVS